jgi:hypothetical protein
MKLPGHETCDYSTFDTTAINMAIEAIDGWLVKVESNLPQAEAEFDRLVAAQGEGSEVVGAVASMLLSLLTDVRAARGTRACLMCEIMNRAYADNEKWDRDNPGFSDPLIRLL